MWASAPRRGAGTSLLNPVKQSEDSGTEKVEQAGIGALGGGLAPAVIGGVARVISPRASTNPQLALLRQEGVAPTVGQALGGRLGALEEKATSLPIMGDVIATARARALEQFNNAAINRAVAPIGKKVTSTGQEGIKEAGDLLTQAYDDALSQVKHVQFDQQFSGSLTQLRGMAQNLVPEMRNKFNTKLRDVLGGRTSPAGAMLGETYKKVDSEIGGLAARYAKSTTASEQEIGDEFKQLQALLRDQMVRSNPQAAQALRSADEGWANLVRLEGAARAAQNAEGVFTPGQLNAAIRAADSSVRKRAVSRGEALMQDLG